MTSRKHERKGKGEEREEERVGSQGEGESGDAEVGKSVESVAG